MSFSRNIFFPVISHSKLFASHAEEEELTVLVLHLKQEIFHTILWICLQYTYFI